MQVRIKTPTKNQVGVKAKIKDMIIILIISMGINVYFLLSIGFALKELGETLLNKHYDLRGDLIELKWHIKETKEKLKNK